MLGDTVGEETRSSVRLGEPSTSQQPRLRARAAAAVGVGSGFGFSFPSASFGFPGCIHLESGDTGDALGLPVVPGGFVWF